MTLSPTPDDGPIEMTEWQRLVLEGVELGHRVELAKSNRSQAPRMPLYESVAAATVPRPIPLDCSRRTR